MLQSFPSQSSGHQRRMETKARQLKSAQNSQDPALKASFDTAETSDNEHKHIMDTSRLLVQVHADMLHSWLA